MSGRLVFDILVGACERYLSAGETRLIRMYCSIDTGYPPMGISQIAVRVNRQPDEIKVLLRRALTKLPRSELEQIKRYLDDPRHKFHSGLTASERSTLMTLINRGLSAQEVKSRLIVKHEPVQQGNPQPREQAQQKSVAPSKAPVRTTALLEEALESLDRPAHCRTIMNRAQEFGWSMSERQTFSVMSNDRSFVYVGEHVFALTRWKNRLEYNGTHCLRYCPTLPTAHNAPADALLELLVTIRTWVQQSPLTYAEVGSRVIRHTGVETRPQDLMDLLYLTGLIQDVDYPQVRSLVMQSAVNQRLDIRTLRQFMLTSALERLPVLPRMLGVLANLYRPELEVIGLNTYGNKLDGGDLLNCLRLLEALGAVENQAGWHVTESGRRALTDWPDVDLMSPNLEDSASMLPGAIDDDLGWLEL